MGSSSGVARGQLRPQFAGRNPPFIVAGLFIALGLLGVSYYSLSTQYTTLQAQLENLIKSEERSRIAFQERNKENELLQKKVDQLKKELIKKSNEVKIKQSDLQKLKNSQQLTENNLASERNRLEAENKGLNEKAGQLQKSIDNIHAENIRLKSQLDNMEKEANEKATKIEQLNSKINQLNGKVPPEKPEDKDAVEVKTDPVPLDPGVGDIDSPNAPGEAANKADGINSAEVIKVKDDPSSIVANPENQKASLPKPNSIAKPDEAASEIGMANLA
ncbi:paramyosin [Tetranychus urticae]|uniref:Uncharacterized protein n=1 Tax=Tetranychus urticae TaxID=32264 RepID=T1JXQ7_TETUR|nr:paramyosin [Tetranychus urticae]